MPTIEAPSPTAVAWSRAHQRRLREMWRSAGWPCQDLIEAELLAGGLLERLRDGAGRETMRVTDAGVRLLAETTQRNRRLQDAHEELVARVALEMQRAGRVVWRGLRLRAPLEVDGKTTWPTAMPDVYSIRNTTNEDYAEPVVHEIKVRRADLLGDLKHEAKREAYRALSSQCWYVIRAGIGQAEEIPQQYGVLIAHPSHLELARPAPRRPLRVSFDTWMVLAKSDAVRAPDDDAQAALAPPADDDVDANGVRP